MALHVASTHPLYTEHGLAVEHAQYGHHTQSIDSLIVKGDTCADHLQEDVACTYIGSCGGIRSCSEVQHGASILHGQLANNDVFTSFSCCTLPYNFLHWKFNLDGQVMHE